MPTIFSRIINGELPCHKIAENDKYLAFLDLRPINPGHTLVIPKQEIDYIFDAEDQMLGEIMAFAKRVAKAVSKAVPCKRIGMMVAGLEVPHLHLHLVPIQSVGDLNFAKATAATDEALRSVAESIRRYWR